MNSQSEAESLDRLIALEWDIIEDLKKMLQKPGISVEEKVRVSNSIAYHAACLNKFLAQKGVSRKDDMSLADFIRSVAPRFARRIRGAYGGWRRKLSLER